MNNRDLQNINSSGELTEIKLGGTADGNKVLTSDEVDAKIPSVGYKVYTALLNKTGGSDPVVEVKENTVGTISVTASGLADISISSSDLFTLGKTFVISSSPKYLTSTTFSTCVIKSISASEIILSQVSNSGVGDAEFVNVFIEIKVYD